MVSIEEFTSMVPPARRRRGSSRLTPYRQQLAQLKSEGYTYTQLQDFLARNGVETSVANIADYFKRNEVMAQKAVAR